MHVRIQRHSSPLVIDEVAGLFKANLRPAPAGEAAIWRVGWQAMAESGLNLSDEELSLRLVQLEALTEEKSEGTRVRYEAERSWERID